MKLSDEILTLWSKLQARLTKIFDPHYQHKQRLKVLRLQVHILYFHLRMWDHVNVSIDPPLDGYQVRDIELLQISRDGLLTRIVDSDDWLERYELNNESIPDEPELQ